MNRCEYKRIIAAAGVLLGGRAAVVYASGSCTRNPPFTQYIEWLGRAETRRRLGCLKKKIRNFYKTVGFQAHCGGAFAPVEMDEPNSIVNFQRPDKSLFGKLQTRVLCDT